MAVSAPESIRTIDSFLSAVKQADAPLSEPGSIGGETSHPVKSVDDRLEKAKEGERSKENEKDVKDDQGAPSVNNAPEAKAASVMDIAARFAKSAEGAVQTPGSASDDSLQIGTNKKPTGEDPSNETGSAKGGKDDPGSSHPARTDNDSLDGHKYAFDDNTPLEKLAGFVAELGDKLCATAVVLGAEKGASTQAPQRQPQAKPQTKQAGLDPRLAEQAGWEMAGLINGTMDKDACDAMVQNTIADIIKEASEDADVVGRQILASRNPQRSKKAGDEPPPDDGAGGGGGGDEDAMMAALGAGGGGGGGAPGGDPMGGGGAPGGDPMGGGAPGGDPMGGGGGGGGIEELLQILQTLSPEELAQVQQLLGGGAEAGGGAPMPGAGGPPPGAGAPGAGPAGAGGMPGAGGGAPGGMEVAANDKTAAVKAGEQLTHVRNVVSELIARSQKK